MYIVSVKLLDYLSDCQLLVHCAPWSWFVRLTQRLLTARTPHYRDY